jgi:D-arabinose 5-phosphate isomerase GutQ
LLTISLFARTGIQSVFLHPLEALHGDLGVVCPCSPSSPCDALLLISHSGATAELMRLLPIVRPRVRTLVAITRDPDSVLARACSGWLDAGTGTHVGPTMDGGQKVTDEADSALPAPTSSVVAALAVGDAVALSLSKMRIGWGKGGKARRLDFLRCHPGGQLGIEVSFFRLRREGRRLILDGFGRSWDARDAVSRGPLRWRSEDFLYTQYPPFVQLQTRYLLDRFAASSTSVGASRFSLPTQAFNF